MHNQAIEQEYLRFRDEGDLAALGAVFDRLAPGLLLVAGHVARDAALAEDLVQTTFLEAIRHADRFTPGRPLLPWLTGILVNHALKERRRARRPLDPARLRQTGEQLPPLEAAQANELAAAVGKALAELPRTYAQVLTLRLVHELEPVQIAHALGCPPETVKTRLRRGLDLLRKLLPPGFALPAALLWAQGRSLAAVREAVLAAGASRAGPLVLGASIPLAIGGFLAMKKLLLGGLVLVGLLLAGFFLIPSPLAAPGPEARAATPLPPPLDAQPIAGPEGLATPEGAPRTTVEETAPSGVTLHGRCVDAETGVPLAECLAEVVRVENATREGRLDFEEVEGPCVATRATGPDGTFAVTFPHAAPCRYLATIRRADRMTRRRFFDGLVAGQDVDLGELPMRWGARVEGRVVDRGGRPIPGVSFRLCREAQERFDPIAGMRYAALLSDAEGRFSVEQLLAPNRWVVRWFDWGFPPEKVPQHIEIRAGEALQRFELVAPVEDASRAIRGTAVDEAGAPVARLTLLVEEMTGRSHTRTDARGRFALFRAGPCDASGEEPIEIALEEGWRLVRPVRCAWGEQDVRVVAAPAAQAVVRPIDGRTGAALQDYVLRFAALDRDTERLTAYLPWMEFRPSGETFVRALRPGPHVVRVEPGDSSLAPTGLVAFDAGALPEKPLVIVVGPAVRVPVLVTEPGGAPVAGTEVELFQRLKGDAAWRTDALLHNRRRRASTRWYNGGTDLQPLGAGRTDSNGEVDLVGAGGSDLLLYVHGCAHLPELVEGIRAEEGMQRVVVVVEKGAALRGRITPAAAFARFGPTPAMERIQSFAEESDLAVLASMRTMAIVRRDPSEQDPREWQPDLEIPVASDGTFAHAGIPPGTYEVILHATLPCGMTDGQQAYLPLGRFSLRQGEEQVIEHDLGASAPGVLNGRVLVNGEPLRFYRLTIHDYSEGKQVFSYFFTDREGWFESWLLPGSYDMLIENSFRASNGWYNFGYWFAARDIAIEPGRELARTFEVRRVKALVRILDAEGRPAPGLVVTMDSEDPPRRGVLSWTTDSEGRIAIEPAPLGPFRLFLSVPDPRPWARRPGPPREVELGPFQVPAAGAEASFEGRLPAE